jgi:hypothetical protein
MVNLSSPPSSGHAFDLTTDSAIGRQIRLEFLPPWVIRLVGALRTRSADLRGISGRESRRLHRTRMG